MRLVYEHYEGTIPKIANGFETVKKYNWKDIITGLHNVMHEHLGIKSKPSSRGAVPKVSSVVTSTHPVSIPKTGKIDRAAARRLLSGQKATLSTSPGTHEVVTQPSILPVPPTPMRILQQNVILLPPKKSIVPSSSTSPPSPDPVMELGSHPKSEIVVFLALDDFNDPKYRASYAEVLLAKDNLSPILLTGSQVSTQIITTIYENFNQAESKKWQAIKRAASSITLVVNVSEVTKLGYYLGLLAPKKVYYIVDIPMQGYPVQNLKYGEIRILINLVAGNSPIYLTGQAASIWINIEDIPEEGFLSQAALYGELL
jgi:hypothetical protein